MKVNLLIRKKLFSAQAIVNIHLHLGKEGVIGVKFLSIHSSVSLRTRVCVCVLKSPQGGTMYADNKRVHNEI